MNPAEFISAVQTLLDPVKHTLTDLTDKVDRLTDRIEDRLPTTEMHRVLSACARGNPACKAVAKRNWVSQVIRHPGTPWLIAFVVTGAMFIAFLAATTGRNANTLVPGVGGDHATDPADTSSHVVRVPAN